MPSFDVGSKTNSISIYDKGKRGQEFLDHGRKDVAIYRGKRRASLPREGCLVEEENRTGNK